ncbi:MAG TPA: Gfo/Idh/MocA family oxidoreductase [Ignavibacteriales bacterium]|nr:Gfo/Idh/MocA family oxidoreductase [Ignavibacteriales bacterium]
MKIGIAGAGFMGETHARCYSKIEDAEIYALAEKNPAKRDAFKEMFHPAKVYDDYLEMLNDSELDIVDICFPTPLHARAAVAALNKDKHVLLEKPIALNLIDAMAIKKAADSSKGKFMVAHVLRFWPEYAAIRKAIKEQFHNEVTEIYASRFNELPLWSEGTWIMSEEQSGGLIVDLMIHDIDFILWNLGKPRRVFCSAIYNEKNFAVQVMAALQMENCSTAYIEGGYLNPCGSGLTTQMRVYGKDTMLELYPNSRGLLKLTQRNNSAKEIKTSGDGYLEEINYFVQCVKQNKNPEIVTIDGAIDSLAVCLELKKSLKEQKWIALS